MDGPTESHASPPESGVQDTQQAQHSEYSKAPAPGDASTAMRHVMSIPAASPTSSPLSSAPATPALKHSLNGPPPHPVTSPLQQPLHTSIPPDLRRTSSAMTLGQQQQQQQHQHRPASSSSPKLARKASRTSLGAQAEEQDQRPTPKRSISNLIANLREAHSTMEPIEEPIRLTAAQIAREHFTRELVNHAQPGVEADTLVVLHDACYGHRYSRLKTTKTTLSMIVERPERIHASVLGASAAYVRLGQHHVDARNAPRPERHQAAPPPFKIRRTARSIDITSSCVTNVHGTAWMSELRGMCDMAGERLAAGVKELGSATMPTETEKRKLHEGDLYLCPESLHAFQGALGGVADAVDSVFHPDSATKRAFVAIRPPGHHCSADFPSGFCWLNNVHVGIEYAAQTHGLTHAAIVDFDLHHGDGSQAITWERNSKNNLKRWNAKPNSKLKLAPDIGYYSLHDINSYPCEMGDDEKVQAASLCVENAHGQSVWNVHLQPWKTEDEFWELYESRYRILLDKARRFLEHHTARLTADGKVPPRAAIFVSAGFDASEWEGAGMQRHKVNVPTDFYARFTREIVQLAQEEGSGCHGVVISVLEGGYSDRALCSGVLSHLSGLCAPSPGRSEHEENSMALDALMSSLRLNGTRVNAATPCDKNWWSAANLTALEQKIHPPPPSLPGKKVRTGPQPTYATPTESFAYKVVNPHKFARSISGTMREMPVPARPPTPPPPEVDWVLATHELSKLLTPSDRQTRSWTAEELGGVRSKKDRESAMPALDTNVDAAAGGEPRQLRDRKAKAPSAYPESAHTDELESVRSVSQSSNRRQTMHELPSAASDPAEPSAGPRQRRASRRLSAGSTLSSLTGELDVNAPPVPTLPRVLPTVPSTANGPMKPPPVPVPALAAQKGSMQIKKTRAPSKPKKAIIPAADGAPVSPTNWVPSSASQLPASGHPTITTANGQPQSGSGDVDSLASHMKRISLKGPAGTKEEHDRKQEEKLAVERRARALKAAETRRVNAAAKKAAAAATTTAATAAEVQQQQSAPAGGAGAADPFAPDFTAAAPVRNVMRAGYPAVMPAAANAPIQQAGAQLNGDETQAALISWQQAGDVLQQVEEESAQPPSEPLMPAPPPSQETAQSEPVVPVANPDPPMTPDSASGLQLTDENNNANEASPLYQHAEPARHQSAGPSTSFPAPSVRSPPRDKKLPIWTSTGAIPFASPGAASRASKSGYSPVTSSSKKLPSSPKSPSVPKSPWRHQRDGSAGSYGGNGNGVGKSMLVNLRDDGVGNDAEIAVTARTATAPHITASQLAANGKEEEEKASSMWDVPETPQKS